MKRHLVECPSCSRHVRVSEERCPFCSAALSAELRSTPRRARIATGLSRAALFALGAAGATAGALACTDDKGTSQFPANGDVQPDQDAQTVPLYGGPPADSSPPPLVDAAYGGPPIDSGPDADADADN